jgi:hypothetical protein
VVDGVAEFGVSAHGRLDLGDAEARGEARRETHGQAELSGQAGGALADVGQVFARGLRGRLDGPQRADEASGVGGQDGFQLESVRHDREERAATLGKDSESTSATATLHAA